MEPQCKIVDYATSISWENRTHISSWSARQLSLAVQLQISSSIIYSLINFRMSTFPNSASHQLISYVPLSCGLAHLSTPTKLRLPGRCLQTKNANEEERFITKKYFYVLGRVWSKKAEMGCPCFQSVVWGYCGLVALSCWKSTNLQPHQGSGVYDRLIGLRLQIYFFSFIFASVSISFAYFLTMYLENS